MESSWGPLGAPESVGEGLLAAGLAMDGWEMPTDPLAVLDSVGPFITLYTVGMTQFHLFLGFNYFFLIARVTLTMYSNL